MAEPIGTNFCGPVGVTGKQDTSGNWIEPAVASPNAYANPNTFVISAGSPAGATIGIPGALTLPTTFTNPVVLDSGITIAGTGFTTDFFGKLVTAIPDTTATALFLITVPAGTAAVAMQIMLLTTITQTSHVGDSSRVAMYNLVVNREGTATATATLSSAYGAAQATTSGGYTITSTTLAVGTITGTTGTDTIQMTIANVNSTASTTSTQVFAQITGNAASVAAIGLS